MTLTRRGLLYAAAAASAVGWHRRAYAAQAIRIGVLTGLSGPLRDTTGPGSVAGATLAAQEFVAANPDFAVQVIESRGWDDVLKLLATTPTADAFPPLSASACPLLRS